MRKTMKKRIGNRSGFTFAEVMLTVLILSLVGVIVATGIPTAIGAYRSIIDTGHAEVLLSTTISRLHDELGTATDVSADPSTQTIAYTNSTGVRTLLTVEQNGITMQEYADVVTDSNRDQFRHLFVSSAAAGKNMVVTYTLESDAYVNGVLTIKDLTVTKNDNILSSIDVVKIRVLAD